MLLGLFKSKVKMVKVKRKGKKKVKRTVKSKLKKSKIKRPKAIKRVTRPKRRKAPVKKISRPAKVMPQIVGKVTHYFPHVKAGVILVTDGTIALGDTLRIKGHTTDFKQKVSSLQINNAPIKGAKPGQEVGFLVKSRVRHNDTVYKL